MEYVTSQSFTIDRIVYSIGVYRSDAGYMAFCDCHTCHCATICNPRWSPTKMLPFGSAKN